MIWLWRNGATTAPADVCVGWQDLSLAADPDPGPVLASTGPLTAVHCSDLKRDRQAARRLARAAGCRVHLSAALRAADHGDWTGLSWALIARQDPLRYRDYMERWTTTAMPGGESWIDVRTRVSAWWAQVERAGPIAVVADLQPLRAIAATICDWTDAEAIAMHLAQDHLACFDPKNEAPARWNLAPGSALAR